MTRFEVIDGNTTVLVTKDSLDAYDLCRKLNKHRSFNRTDVYVREHLFASSEQHTASSELEAYRFWFTHGGFAFYYLDYRTGVFQIYSDWGDYSYAWPAVCRAKNEALLDFIKKADRWYLTGKLARDLDSSSRSVFSEQKSTNHVKDVICRARRQNKITKKRANDLWVWVENFKHHDDLDHDRGFYTHISDNEDFCDALDCEVHEVLVYEKSYRILFLQESLIPFFHRFLKGEPYLKEKNHG